MSVGGAFRLPQLGQHDTYPTGVKVASIIVGATSSDGDENIVTVGSDSEELIAFRIAKNTHVYDVVPLVETAFTANVNVNVGDTDDTDGWAAEIAIGATTISRNLVYTSDGSSNLQYNARGGKFFPTSSGVIEVGFSTATAAVGRLRLIVRYAFLGSSGGMAFSSISASDM